MPIDSTQFAVVSVTRQTWTLFLSVYDRLFFIWLESLSAVFFPFSSPLELDQTNSPTVSSIMQRQRERALIQIQQANLLDNFFVTLYIKGNLRSKCFNKQKKLHD